VAAEVIIIVVQRKFENPNTVMRHTHVGILSTSYQSKKVDNYLKHFFSKKCKKKPKNILLFEIFFQ
jgi:hypothetical protein